MYTIAYLIAAHTDFDMLLKLCNQLVKSGDVFIHIDKKVAPECYQALLDRFDRHNFCGSGKVCFIKERISVYWAGFSQVRLQRLLLRFSLETTEKEYSRFVFLSGLCYPIKSSRYILDEFEKNHSKEYICGMNLTNYDNKDQKIRYAGYHLFRDTNIRPTFLKKFLIAASRKILWELKIRKPYVIKHCGGKEDIYFGGSWIALTRECAQYVYDNLSNKSIYYKYFKTSYASDELCIPTIVFNSRFRFNACTIDESCYDDSTTLFSALSPMHILQYRKLIKVYNEQDYEQLIKSNKLFVRKVFAKESERLIKMLNASFYTQQQ